MSRKDHEVNNMGDFLTCGRPGCIWSATWSMGHICDHCRLAKCICPCPLTKEKTEEMFYEIGLKKVCEFLLHDKSSIETQRRMSKKEGLLKESRTEKWENDGILQEIERIFEYVPQLKRLRDE